MSRAVECTRHDAALDAFYDTFPTAEEAWWITAETLGEVATRA